MPLTTNVIIGTDVMRAVGSLCQRDIVLIPTETEYVLACNALDLEAVRKLRAMEAMPAASPLEIYVPSIEKLGRYVRELPSAFERLMERFVPGPMTYMLPRKHVISDWVTAGMDKVAIRVPSHPLTLSLLKKLNFPLAVLPMPSFQTAGGNGYDILDEFGGIIGYVLDGGATAYGPGSTWVEFEEESILIHRTGSVSRETIERLTGLPTYQYLAPMTPERIATTV